MVRGSFPPPLAPAARDRLRQRLLAWYRREARDLPWRRTSDPYAIWVSEAMLQQTRVETVLAYYGPFLGRFPDVETLAAAPEEAVLSLWSGLGYYRRARALQAAARRIVGEHGGRFPRTRAALLALPGVGPYTAGALLSIAHDQPEPLVDGNVERVFSRLFGLDAAAGSPALSRECWSRARGLVPERGAGEWNQALMELGARVCTPRGPVCDVCPVARSCRARAQGRVSELPGPRSRPAARAVELDLLFAERDGRLLLERRGEGGRMAGLWQLPTHERPGPRGARSGLFPGAWPPGAQLVPGPVLLELRHSITHHRVHAVVRGAAAWGAPPPPAWRWVGGARLASLPLTGMAKKALAGLQRRRRPAEGP